MRGRTVPILVVATVRPTAVINAEPDGLAIDTRTHTLYTVDEADSVSVVDTRRCNAEALKCCSTERVGTVSLPPCSGPRGIAIDVATGTVYVTNQGSDVTGHPGHTVSVIDTATCNSNPRAGCARPAARMRVDADPIGVAIDRGTDTVFVGTNGGATLSVIDAATCNATDHAGCNRTPATITVGRSPFGPGITGAVVGSGAVLSNGGPAHVV